MDSPTVSLTCDALLFDLDDTQVAAKVAALVAHEARETAAGWRPASLAHASPIRMTASTRFLAALLLAVAGTACGPDGVVLPPFAVAFTPPPVYAAWWQMVESCAGRQGDLGSIRWYQVPGTRSLSYPEKHTSAYWDPRSNIIVIAGLNTDRGDVVRHEMLHALLRAAGHPRSHYLERCAGIVACPEGCVEGEFHLPRDAALVPVDSLELTLTVVPTQPSARLASGYFRVEVVARNPMSQGVMVLPRLPSDVAVYGFSVELIGPAGGIGLPNYVVDESTIYFEPGESKRHVFDFVVGDDVRELRPPPGAYVVYGRFGRRWTGPTTFEILP